MDELRNSLVETEICNLVRRQLHGAEKTEANMATIQKGVRERRQEIINEI